MVTLVAATSVVIEATIIAMQRSMRHVRFGAALLLSDRRPATLPEGVEWRPIAPLRGRDAYSRFMLKELHRHIETDHALCVQWDSHVLNGAVWSSDFLSHDYIGAPWLDADPRGAVGNGGFSLRSKRLLVATTDAGIGHLPAEDVAIGRVHRALLEERHGIRFAPVDVARRFAFERGARRGDEFGFHGVFNLVRLLDRSELRALPTLLEKAVLKPNETRELLRWAASCGRWRFAAGLLRAMRQR